MDIFLHLLFHIGIAAKWPPTGSKPKSAMTSKKIYIYKEPLLGKDSPLPLLLSHHQGVSVSSESSPHWCQAASNHSETNRAAQWVTFTIFLTCHPPSVPPPPRPPFSGLWLIQAIELSEIKSKARWAAAFPSCSHWLRTFFDFFACFSLCRTEKKKTSALCPSRLGLRDWLGKMPMWSMSVILVNWDR